jgi:hypothetical protein
MEKNTDINSEEQIYSYYSNDWYSVNSPSEKHKHMYCKKCKREVKTEYERGLSGMCFTSVRFKCIECNSILARVRIYQMCWH